MTILFVADNIGGGGKERRMLELIKSLSKDPSYTIILISLSDMGVGYKYMYDFPITIIETDRKHRFTVQPFFIIKNAIKKYKPDIVHSWGSMGSLYMLPLLLFRKFKFINGIIADAPAKINWYQKPYIRGQLTYPFSDVVLSNSLAGIRSYDAPVRKTFCIYNGIDMARFENLRNPLELKKEMGIENFSYVVGMVGAFHDRKDYITYVKAAKKVVDQQRDICFLLIGEGKNREPIAEMITEEYKKNILILGRRADVEDLIQTFDVGVLCTNSEVHGEGVSNSIIEYMSLQKPVIATEGGGTNEVINHNGNGYLIKHKGADELAEKILYLYSHPQAAREMGEKALDTIKEKFLLGRMTDEFIEVYKGRSTHHKSRSPAMKTNIRNIAGYFIANTLIRSGFVKRARLKVQKNNYILSLCFHAPSRSLFESSITWLTKKGFHFISVNDLEQIAAGTMPFPKSAVVITIDDGWQSNLDNIIPIVAKNKIPVTIFISTEVVEKGNGYWWSYIYEARKRGMPGNSVEFFKTIDNEDRLKIIEETKEQINLNREALSVEQVKEISKNKYVSFGSHSVTHPILPKCSVEKSTFEISQSKKTIEKWIGDTVTHFAYPNGDFTDREVEILKQTGYTIAFSTEQTYLTQQKLIDQYKLPRLIMVENASFEENICRMMGIWIKKPRHSAT